MALSTLLKTPFDRFRLISIAEGISFLLLLGIAMPIKYGLGVPEPVFVVGMAHGILFIVYCLALLHVWIAERWTLLMAGLGFMAAVLPFGPFVFDSWVRRRRVPIDGTV